MAKKKKKVSFYGLELQPHEDEKLLELLTDKDMTAKQLIRMLLRDWITNNEV